MDKNNIQSKKIYFIGIGGIGMAGTAVLMKKMGHQVFGSDLKLFHPSKTLLLKEEITPFEGFAALNVQQVQPDLVVVGNRISADHPEWKFTKKNNIPYTSFPRLLQETLLKDRKPIVVTGTHGKTTTTSLITHLLKGQNLDPGYFLGGQCPHLDGHAQVGQPPWFVIEGDEYDTALFDKKSKFLHYRPSIAVINNIEFDHADIFSDLDEIKSMFYEFLSICKDPSQIIFNGDDPEVVKVLDHCGVLEKALDISPYKGRDEADISIKNFTTNRMMSLIELDTPHWGTLHIESPMFGSYNGANIAHAVGVLEVIRKSTGRSINVDELQRSLATFSGVSRRMDKLASSKDIEVYEDFAHHPTAVEKVVTNFKKTYPDRHLIVAFEPANATSRRNVFYDRYKDAFAMADHVMLAPCSEDQRIPPGQRMNTQDLANCIGDQAVAYEGFDALDQELRNRLTGKSTVIFMSSGSFSGLAQKTAGWLKNAK